MREFHTPSLVLAEQVKMLHKNILQLICITKKEYYLKMVQEADSHNIWTYRKWTQNKRMYTSPPISRGTNATLAISHEDKCQALQTHLFPELPALLNEPRLDLDP